MFLNSDPVVRDDMNNYISQYYSEVSSGKSLFALLYVTKG